MEDREAKAARTALTPTYPKGENRNIKGSKTHPQPNTTQDCSENVHFLENSVNKYMTGDRVSTGIRVDKGLYLRFKTVSKAIYGSTCRAIELYMIALIETAEKGVHFSNTLNGSVPIQIEKIVIERNLRPRRSLPMQSFEEETVETVKRTVTKRKVESKFVEYGKYGLERLQTAYSAAVRSGNHVQQMMISAELQRRGFKPDPHLAAVQK